MGTDNIGELSGNRLGAPPRGEPRWSRRCKQARSRDLNFATFSPTPSHTKSVFCVVGPVLASERCSDPCACQDSFLGAPARTEQPHCLLFRPREALYTRQGKACSVQGSIHLCVHDVHKQRCLSWHCLMRRCRPAPRERWRLKRATLEFSILAGSVVAACKRHTEWRRCTVVVLMHGKSLADHALLPASHRPHASFFGSALRVHASASNRSRRDAGKRHIGRAGQNFRRALTRAEGCVFLTHRL